MQSSKALTKLKGGDMDHSQAKKMLLDWLENKLHAYSGLRQKEKMTVKEKQEWVIIMQESYRDKSWMTLRRLESILVKGCSGEYGEFTSLNKLVFRNWINQFYRDNQHEIDKERRDYAVKSRTELEKEVLRWYEAGLKKFKDTYNQCKKDLAGKEDYSYHSIPADIEFGGVWYKVLEEAGLISVPVHKYEALIAQQQKAMEIEANRHSEFKVSVAHGGVDARVKNMLVRMEVVKWIMQDLDIDDLFREYRVEEIRKRNFFAPLVNQ